MDLKNINTQTTWNEAAERINSNNLKIISEVTKLQNATYKNKGYFKTLDELQEAHPTSSKGCIAYVGASSPFSIYLWNEETKAWEDSGEEGGDDEVVLDNYYTKEEIKELHESMQEVLPESEYDALESKEKNKLYFCYEG